MDGIPPFKTSSAVTLEALGWTAALGEAFETAWGGRADVRPARVAIEFNHHYRVYVAGGEREAVVAGGLKHKVTSRGELPAVGDWVALRQQGSDDRGAIVAVLPRRSRFSRKMVGQVTDEQVVAANVDRVFIVMALDLDFSVRRVERYLLLAREGGADPAVLLTKPDLCDDLPARVADVVSVANDAPVHVLNPRAGEGLASVVEALPPGRTGALLGSSGVGKTTIINRLVGQDLRRTLEVREADSKGRHATTHRELIVLPHGGLLIDTPGMRELQLWEADTAVAQTFDDVDAHAASCHFSDCQHRDEPRCGVKAAVERGELAADRYEGFLKVQDELAFLAKQRDERALREDKRRAKILTKAANQHIRTKRG
jgi:ribosome biogenesis GTPase